jgi:hypothetical protein
MMAGTRSVSSPEAAPQQQQQQQQQKDATAASLLQQLLAEQYQELIAGSAAAPPYMAAAELNHSSSCQGLLEGPSEGFILHPALLESALQTQALAPVPEQLAAAEGAMGMWVPAAIAGFHVGTAAPGVKQLAVAGCPEQSSSSSSSSSTMLLYTDGSIPVGSIVCAEFRPLQGGEAAAQLAAAGALAAPAAEPAAAAAGPSLSDDELALLVQSTVEGVLGQAVGAEEPLMAAGLDSLGATEVRRAADCIRVRLAASNTAVVALFAGPVQHSLLGLPAAGL